MMTKSQKKSQQGQALLLNQQSALEQKIGPIDYRDPNALTNYLNNPRKHPERQIVGLMASISQFGFMLPALIDTLSCIVVGEARVEAARRLKMKSIPTITVDHLSKAQLQAYRLADNRLAELSAWDAKLLAIEIGEIIKVDEVPVEIMGWSTVQIDVILDAVDDADPASDPADAPVGVPASPVTREGDIWLLGDHRIICGSSLDPAVWDALMAGKSGAMAFTDPPYNVRIDGHVSGLGKVQHREFAMASGEMTSEQFVGFLTGFLKAMSGHLTNGAIVDCCMDWRHLPEAYEAIAQAGLSVINLCVWNKTNGGMGSLYRSKHELVLITKVGDGSHVNNVDLGKHGRYRTNVWDYAGVNAFGVTRDQDLEDHPTVKPVALVADAIRDVSKIGDIVVDAFLGSGTTLLAAHRTKRIGYGIEIDPRYVDVAIRRWETMTGEEARLEATGQSWRDVADERSAAVQIAA